MKKIILLSALAASLFAGSTANAQVRVNVQIGAPAYYDPNGAYGYDDDYYYMPEYQAYYSPIRRMYFYNEGGRWMTCGYLPQRFHGVAYGRGNWQRVRGRSPWMGGGYNNGYRGGNGHQYNGGGNNYAYHYNHRDNNGYGNNGGNYQNNGGYRGGNNGNNGNGGYNGGNNGNNGYHNGNNGQPQNGGGQHSGGYHGGNSGGSYNGGSNGSDHNRYNGGSGRGR